KPIAPTVRARIPANGPNPTATTKTTARTSSGTPLCKTITALARNDTQGPGDVLRAARSAIGSAIAIPITVAARAIHTVSSIAERIPSQLVAKSGGNMRPATRAIPDTASPIEAGVIPTANDAATKPTVATDTATAFIVVDRRRARPLDSTVPSMRV